MAPAVSFLVLAYNYGRFLPECLESILGQHFTDWEAFILDDASTDDTPEVARIYADARIAYVRQARNLGLTGNCNDGVSRARGKYVWIISADDVLHDPEVLGTAVAIMERDSRIGVVFSGAVRLGAGEERVAHFEWGPEPRRLAAPALAEGLVEANRVCAPGALARRSLYERIGPGPASLRAALDWYFWFRFGLLADAQYLPRPLSRYRIHHQNMTAANSLQPMPDQLSELIALRLWMEGFAVQSPEIPRRAQACAEAELRLVFAHWVQHLVPKAEAAAYVENVVSTADAITPGVASVRPRLRAALRRVAKPELRAFWRSRRPRAFCRGWRMARFVDRRLGAGDIQQRVGGNALHL